MNAEPTSSPASVAPADDSGSQPGRRFHPWLLLFLVVFLALAGWLGWTMRASLLGLQQEMTQGLAAADAATREAQAASQQLRAQVVDLQARLEAAETGLGEYAGQREAMRTLLDELSRRREEVRLLEVEQAITLAAQQLQLAGNVPLALQALSAADSQLARLEGGQYLPLRKSLRRDIETLAALPLADIAGLSLQLEGVIAAVDRLPLLLDARPANSPEAPAEAVAGSWWRHSASQLWQEVRALVRIQRFDRADPVLLAPGQEFFLRENLKLRLLNARLALFARDPSTFRNELKATQEWLGRFFQPADPAVLAAMSSVRELAAARLVGELPDLAQTRQALAVLRTPKATR